MALVYPSRVFLCFIAAWTGTSLRLLANSTAKQIAPDSRRGKSFKGSWSDIRRKMLDSGLPWEVFLHAAVASNALYKNILNAKDIAKAKASTYYHDYLIEQGYELAEQRDNRVAVWLPKTGGAAVIFAIRGTKGTQDVLTDLNMTLFGIGSTRRFWDDQFFTEHPLVKRARNGMYSQMPWVITGQSLGAAIAARLYFSPARIFDYAIVFNRPYTNDHLLHVPTVDSPVQNLWIFDKEYDLISSECHTWGCNPRGSNWMELEHRGSVQFDPRDVFDGRLSFGANHRMGQWIQYMCCDGPGGSQKSCRAQGSHQSQPLILSRVRNCGEVWS